MSDRHSDHRTEVAIQYAEKWADAQPVDEYGVAIDESVGIVRQLVSLLMKNDEPAGIYRGGSAPIFGLWRKRSDGVWLFSMPVEGEVWRRTTEPGVTPMWREGEP